MSWVTISPRAAALLGRAPAPPEGTAPASLAVAALDEWPAALEKPPRALLLLATPGEVLPAGLDQAPFPLDLAWVPLQPGELRLRSRRLLRAPAGGVELATQALIGRISSSVAQEMGNALSYSCTNVEYLRQAIDAGRERDPELGMVAAEAEQGVRRALETCRAVLQLGAAAEEPTRVDVNETLQRTLGLLKCALPRSIRLEAELATVPEAMADASGMMRVLASLILGATEAAGVGGRVVVRTEHQQSSVLVSVADTRPGAPDELGAGILEGLVVESFGGTLEVAPASIGGADVRMVLQASREMPAAFGRPLAFPAPDSRSRRV